MRDLVPFAVMVRDLTGSFSNASTFCARLTMDSNAAFDSLGIKSDVRVLATRQARELGILDSEGQAEPVRVAELTLVLDIISRVPRPQHQPVPEHPLVFTVPEEANGLLEPRQRLDLFVADVIRDAKESVHLGGPFWNREGLDLVRAVLEPAIRIRQVECNLFVHSMGPNQDGMISAFVSKLPVSDRVRTWWYHGNRGSLMHAKFVIADRARGYLGTANLTSYGLEQHMEVGVGLSETQAEDLVELMERSVSIGLFSTSPSS